MLIWNKLCRALCLSESNVLFILSFLVSVKTFFIFCSSDRYEEVSAEDAAAKEETTQVEKKDK